MKKSLWAALFSLMILAGCTVHYDETNISRIYDHDWIVGSNRREIENKYGEFNREFISDDGRDLGAYYVNYDNSGMDPSYIHDTYFVEFENDVAVDAYFAQTSIGG